MGMNAHSTSVTQSKIHMGPSPVTAKVTRTTSTSKVCCSVGKILQYLVLMLAGKNVYQDTVGVADWIEGEEQGTPTHKQLLGFILIFFSPM